MSTERTVRLTITDYRGALGLGDVPTRRSVDVGELPAEVAGDLAAIVLDLPPTWPTPEPGTHQTAKAGGRVVVTLEETAPS